MDFDQIALTRSERAALKRSAKKTIPITCCARLLRFHLVEEEYEHKPGYQGKPLGICRITDKGRDYLLYSRQSRQLLYLKSMWLPIGLTLATNLILRLLEWLSPHIKEWFAHILPKLLLVVCSP